MRSCFNFQLNVDNEVFLYNLVFLFFLTYTIYKQFKKIYIIIIFHLYMDKCNVNEIKCTLKVVHTYFNEKNADHLNYKTQRKN